MKGRPASGVLRCAPWVEILHHLDGIVDIAVLEVKYYNQWNEREAFRQLPRSISLAAGIVDEGSYYPEPVKKLRERIAGWARIVGEERFWASPSCGFGRHTARDIPIPREGSKHGRGGADPLSIISPQQLGRASIQAECSAGVNGRHSAVHTALGQRKTFVVSTIAVATVK